MRVLIAGAAGFLGSNLTRKFLDEGHEVHGIDDFSTGSKTTINYLSQFPRFIFTEHDVRQPMSFQFDAVLNFACPASPPQYQIDPVRTIETNFLGMANVLKNAFTNKARVIQSSTSEVYGDPNISPQIETYWGNVNPIGIRSCYDEGKRAAETLCFDYKRQFGLDVRVLRIFNTYGPGMAKNDGRVVSNFIEQALASAPITIYGDGKQTRSFCFVADLVEAIYTATVNEHFPDTPINIGNPTECAMIDLAQNILELTNSKSQINFMPLPLDDPRQRKPDISLAKKYLDWHPKISLKTGLLETIEYFKGMN